MFESNTTWLPPPFVGLRRRVAVPVDQRPGRGSRAGRSGSRRCRPRRSPGRRTRGGGPPAGRRRVLRALGSGSSARRRAGRPRSSTAVVLGAVVGLQEDALARSAAHRLRHVLADRGPVVDPVVADRLVRRDVLDAAAPPRRAGRRGPGGEQRARVRRQVVERVEHVLGALVERRRLAQHRACRPQRAGGGRQRHAHLGGHRLERREAGSRRRPGTGAGPGTTGCRRRACRAALDRLPQRLGVARERLEGVRHVPNSWA